MLLRRALLALLFTLSAPHLFAQTEVYCCPGTGTVTAFEVPFDPFGTVSATNAQDAIEELDTEKKSEAELLAEDGVAVIYAGGPPYNMVCDNSTNATAAFQAAIDAAEAVAAGAQIGAVVQLPSGQCVHNSVTINTGKVTIAGRVGKRTTVLRFVPTAADQVGILFDGAGALLVHNGIRDVMLFKGTATRAVALRTIDTNTFILQNVQINGYGDGLGSTGWSSRGRDSLQSQGIIITADRPVLIEDNPNHTIDYDLMYMEDAQLLASGNPCIEIADGVNLTRAHFTHILCVGGTGILRSVNTIGTQISQNLLIDGAFWEQGTTTGPAIDVRYTGPLLYNLNIRRASCSSCTLIRLRGVQQATITESQALEASQILDVDATVDSLVLNGLSAPNGGATSSIVGQPVALAAPTEGGEPVPSFAAYATASATNPVRVGSPFIAQNSAGTEQLSIGITSSDLRVASGGGLTLTGSTAGVKAYGRAINEGTFTDVAFSAANFTALTGSWTVDTADQITLKYALDGNRMSVKGIILNTDMSSATSTIAITIPAGKIADATNYSDLTAYTSDAGGAWTYTPAVASGTTITFYRPGFTGNWTATSADNTSIRFHGDFEITNP